jgi:hypothetical protein
MTGISRNNVIFPLEYLGKIHANKQNTKKQSDQALWHCTLLRGG